MLGTAWCISPSAGWCWCCVYAAFELRLKTWWSLEFNTTIHHRNRSDVRCLCHPLYSDSLQNWLLSFTCDMMDKTGIKKQQEQIIQYMSVHFDFPIDCKNVLLSGRSPGTPEALGRSHEAPCGGCGVDISTEIMEISDDMQWYIYIYILLYIYMDNIYAYM